MPTLDNAIELIEDRGFVVIPVHHPEMELASLPDFVRGRVDPKSRDFNERDIGKIPLVKWEAYQKTAPKRGEIEAWWKKWPSANVGVVCGQESNAFVADVDGPEALAFLDRIGIHPGDTLTARTGRGHQFYFLWPGFEVANRIGQIFGGLDIKGAGGYVVAPPSRHRMGADYAWMDGPAIPMPAPEELLEIIRQQAKRKTEKYRLPSEEVARLLTGPIPDGDRHNSAKTLFAHWIAIGMSEKAIREAAYTWGQKVCVPPGDDAHLQKIVTWALEQETLKRRNPEEAQVSRKDDALVFAWPDLGLKATLAEPHRERGGTQCTLEVSSEAHGLLHFGRIILESTSAREELIHPTRGKLTRLRSDINWTAMLERAFQRAVKEFRLWYAPIDLADAKPKRSGREVITGVLNIVEDAISIVFADMSTGKSTLGLACAVALTTGKVVGGLHPRSDTQPSNCLIIDNENLTADENALRLHALCKGLGIPVPRGIKWWHMTNSLSEDKQSVLEFCNRENVGFIVVDSFAGAAGGDPETARAGGYLFQALHYIGRTSLVIAHVAKESLLNGGIETDGATAYGSVFNTARPRNAWGLRAIERTDSTLTVQINHRKVNLGKKRPPQWIRFTYVGAGDIPDEILVDVPNNPPRQSGTDIETLLTEFARDEEGLFTIEAAAEYVRKFRYVKSNDIVGRILRKMEEKGVMERGARGTYRLPHGIRKETVL